MRNRIVQWQKSIPHGLPFHQPCCTQNKIQWTLELGTIHSIKLLIWGCDQFCRPTHQLPIAQGTSVGWEKRKWKRDITCIISILLQEVLGVPGSPCPPNHHTSLGHGEPFKLCRSHVFAQKSCSLQLALSWCMDLNLISQLNHKTADVDAGLTTS